MEYYHIVPWFNSAEWHEVFDKIFPSSYPQNMSYEEPLKLLTIWKARCPSLPSGIESTFGLLQVLDHDKSTDNIRNGQCLSLTYAAAIMRFVNHMLDTETAKGTSLYQAANALNIPDWIIDLRHDVAHNNNLPSLSLLREAAYICLNWLGDNYWRKHKIVIQDYKSGQKELHARDENKLATLMHLCLSLSICAHSKCNMKNLSDIPNPTMKESIVNDTRDLFGDCIDLSNLKTVSLKSLINVIDVQSTKLLKNKDASTLVNKALLGEDSTFLSMELLNFFSGKEFRKKSKLNRSYVQCFGTLLTFLHTHELLSEFTLELIKITQCDTSDKHKATLAALWVSEILKALGKCKSFSAKINKMKQEDMTSKKKSELLSLYHHWFPNDKENGLMLNLCKPVPVHLTDINVVQSIMSVYNPYLAHFAKGLLNLVEPELPSLVVERILNLTRLISTPEKFPMKTSSRIYTEDDLKKADGIVNLTEDLELDESEGFIVDSDENISNALINTMWKVASTNHNWAACPLGQVPWQFNMEVDDNESEI